MLEVRSLFKYYGWTPALRQISFTAGPGEIIGLLGENGAGKTTLLKTLLGFLPVESGEVLLDGDPVGPKNYSRIAFATSEHTFFGGMTPLEHQAFYQSVFPKFNPKRFSLLMDFFNLPAKKAVHHFSLGMKNQFEAVLALSQGADYILMDEPFSGSDIFGREDFYKLLLGILTPEETLVISTHLVEEVRHFLSRVLLLQKGELIADQALTQLEEEGIGLADWLREKTGRTGSRAAQLLQALEDGEERGGER